MTNTELRRKVAGFAKQYCLGELFFEQFLELAPEPDQCEDDDIFELLDLVEHEPQKGGLFGVSGKEHARHMARIDALIAKLLNEPQPLSSA